MKYSYEGGTPSTSQLSDQNIEDLVYIGPSIYEGFSVFHIRRWEIWSVPSISSEVLTLVFEICTYLSWNIEFFFWDWPRSHSSILLWIICRWRHRIHGTCVQEDIIIRSVDELSSLYSKKIMYLLLVMKGNVVLPCQLRKSLFLCIFSKHWQPPRGCSFLNKSPPYLKLFYDYC